MVSQHTANEISIIRQIINAQDLLEDAEHKINLIAQSTPDAYRLAGDVSIDVETALEAIQNIETSAHKFFNGLQRSS